MVKFMMKLIICSILFTVSCKKEISYPEAPIYSPGSQEYGWSNAMKNGLPFEASGLAREHSDRPNDFWGFYMETYTEWGAERESIYIAELEYKLGSVQVLNNDENQENGIPIGFYATSTDDGDVSEDNYRIDSRQSNWIEIISIDTINGEQTISGKYNLHFKIDSEKRNPLNPDHVRFIEGTFEVRFQQ